MGCKLISDVRFCLFGCSEVNSARKSPSTSQSVSAESTIHRWMMKRKFVQQSPSERKKINYWFCRPSQVYWILNIYCSYFHSLFLVKDRHQIKEIFYQGLLIHSSNLLATDHTRQMIWDQQAEYQVFLGLLLCLLGCLLEVSADAGLVSSLHIRRSVWQTFVTALSLLAIWLLNILSLLLFMYMKIGVSRALTEKCRV